MCARTSLLLLVTALCACGDPLEGAAYQGEPLMTLSGQVLLEEALPELSGEVRVALFWSSQGGHGQQHEQQVAIATSFPSSYTLTLYTPPPDKVLYQPPHASGPVGIAVPMLYEDLDGSGLYDQASEQVLGGSQDVLVLWSAEALHPREAGDGPPDTGTQGGANQGEGPPDELEPGYHAVQQLGSSCDQGQLALSLADPDEVALAIGELWDSLTDMDCDGDLDEWGGL